MGGSASPYDSAAGSAACHAEVDETAIHTRSQSKPSLIPTEADDAASNPGLQAKLCPDLPKSCSVIPLSFKKNLF